MKEKEWRFFPALVVWYDFIETFELSLRGPGLNRENKTDRKRAPGKRSPGKAHGMVFQRRSLGKNSGH